MFEKMFEMAVVISAVDRFTGPMMRAVAKTETMNKEMKAMKASMAGLSGEELVAAEARMAALQQQALKTEAALKSAKTMALVGGGVTVFGAAVAFGLIKAAEAAGVLETSMMGVKEALKLSNTEFNTAMNLSQTVGIPTIFSAEQVGGIMQAMATSGLTKQQVLNPDILRQYVDFADVQKQIKGEDPNNAVASAVGMAHMFQIYNTRQLTPFLNNLNAALLHTHESASEFATTFRYVAGQAKMGGMNAEQTLALTAWLGRMGFGHGRGGTNFADFMTRSIYGSSGKKADSAMVQAGFVQNGHSIFENAQGKFVGIPAAVAIMQEFAKRFGNNANLMSPLLHSIFGTQGARIAMMMASGGAGDQYTRVLGQIGNTATISQSQKDLNNTWQGQTKQLETTLQDIQQAFGRYVKPDLMPVLKTINRILGAVLHFEQQNPKMVAFIAIFLGVAAAAALVVGPLMLAFAAMKWMQASGFIEFIGRITGVSKLWAGVQWLVNGAMDANPIALIILGIAALIGIIVLLVTHWKQVVTWIMAAWNWYQHLGDKVKWLIAVFFPFLGIPLLIISKWKVIETFFSNLWTRYIQPVLNAIGNNAVVKWAESLFGAGGAPPPSTSVVGARLGNTSYAQLSPGASGSGGDTHIHLHAGSIVVQAANGREGAAGQAVYKALTGQAVRSVRARGGRPLTSY